jgi:mRNA interferase RelE/StbE
MNWQVLVHPKVGRCLKRFPQKDAKRIEIALNQFEIDPFTGDIEKMKGEENVWRRRVGSYRISYELYPRRQVVYVYRVERRTTTTYRKKR